MSIADLQTASEIANALADAAIRDDTMAGWSGATAAPAVGLPAVWCVFGGDYYEGSAGIARFLAWTAVHGDGAASHRLIGAALNHALARSDGWSLHSGRLGAGLVTREVGVLLGDAALWQAGTQACGGAIDAALAAAESGEAVMTDMLAGLAGALHAAARLAAAAPALWHDRALRLGAALAGLAVPAEGGLAWPMHSDDPQLLCGLAHGAAGVALAFDDLAAIDPNEARWPGLAAAARQFERAHFNSHAASWADLRSDISQAQQPDAAPPDAAPPCPHFWCHGSVGVAWERLLAHRASPACDVIAVDLAAGLHGARREAVRVLSGPVGPGAGASANGSQCHGLAGLIDLLIETGEAGDRILAQRLAAFMRADGQRADGWRCGLPGMEYSPGMMLGVAGIGWGLLRASLPDVVPPGWTPASSLACAAATNFDAG